MTKDGTIKTKLTNATEMQPPPKQCTLLQERNIEFRLHPRQKNMVGLATATDNQGYPS